MPVTFPLPKFIRDLQRTSKALAECPHPNKVKFPSRNKARKRARQIPGMTAYECVCGEWHLSSSVGGYEPSCPVCGCPSDVDCGCYIELHSGDRD
jgi:hypothetical protein